MQEIKVLGALNYESPSEHNYGDCILINDGAQLFVYDCGSKEHANEVIAYMDAKGIEKANLILSHNDSDHFNGIPTLLEANRVKKIYTTLLLKYVDEILERIDDKRRTRESVKKAILEKYSNIAKLTGAPIVDIYEEQWKLSSEINIVGPDKEYMLDTVAKNLDGREGDTTDGETNVNATSIQLSVDIAGQKLILCGDCAFVAIQDKLEDYNVIQLPHHGKAEQAEKIFDGKANDIHTYYIVSDNTGNTKGGSDNLETTGHKVYNTKVKGDICINANFFDANKTKRVGGLG